MRIVLLVAAVLLTATLLTAQDELFKTESIRCTIEGLNSYYTGLVAEGQAALDTAPRSGEIPQETFGVLYEAGKSLQARMLECGYIPADIRTLPIGADTSVERVLEILDTLTSDPLRGQLLYLGQENSSENVGLGCSGCHEIEGAVGPATEGTWTRWDEEHRLVPQYAEQSFAYYAVESILHPNVYVVPGFLENVMPPFYATALGYQDLADLIAFLESQDQLLDE